MSQRNWRCGGNDEQRKWKWSSEKNVFDHDNENDIHDNNVDNNYNDNRLFDFPMMIAMIIVEIKQTFD